MEKLYMVNKYRKKRARRELGYVQFCNDMGESISPVNRLVFTIGTAVYASGYKEWGRLVQAFGVGLEMIKYK
jgi:hypothetical protein